MAMWKFIRGFLITVTHDLPFSRVFFHSWFTFFIFLFYSEFSRSSDVILCNPLNWLCSSILTKITTVLMKIGPKNIYDKLISRTQNLIYCQRKKLMWCSGSLKFIYEHLVVQNIKHQNLCQTWRNIHSNFNKTETTISSSNAQNQRIILICSQWHPIKFKYKCSRKLGLQKRISHWIRWVL